MSSLAAARADNFYYPPEWSPKKGGLNKFHGQHALRERARKLDQGILIIRFEMPFNIWCGGCNSMIAKGVRFNAEKKQVGNYYSTKIWSFTMKSPCCKHEIVIQTDPKNTEYVIISGAQKKTDDFDVEDAETLLLPADEDRDKLADPMYRLEHQEEDLKKKKEAEPVLVRLQRLSDSRQSDDYALNRALRDRLRSQKKRVAEEKSSARKLGLGVRLLPPSAEDAAAAASVKFASKFEKSRKDKRASIKAASICLHLPGIIILSPKEQTRPFPEEAEYKSGSSHGTDGGQGEAVLVAEHQLLQLKVADAGFGNAKVRCLRSYTSGYASNLVPYAWALCKACSCSSCRALFEWMCIVCIVTVVLVVSCTLRTFLVVFRVCYGAGAGAGAV